MLGYLNSHDTRTSGQTQISSPGCVVNQGPNKQQDKRCSLSPYNTAESQDISQKNYCYFKLPGKLHNPYVHFVVNSKPLPHCVTHFVTSRSKTLTQKTTKPQGNPPPLLTIVCIIPCLSSPCHYHCIACLYLVLSAATGGLLAAPTQELADKLWRQYNLHSSDKKKAKTWK